MSESSEIREYMLENGAIDVHDYKNWIRVNDEQVQKIDELFDRTADSQFRSFVISFRISLTVIF